jgi:hypothetical protein
MNKRIDLDSNSTQTTAAEFDDFELPVSPPSPSAESSLNRPADPPEAEDSRIHLQLISGNKVVNKNRPSDLPLDHRDKYQPLWIKKLYWFPPYWIMCAFFGVPIGAMILEPHSLLGGILVTTLVALVFYGFGLIVESRKMK